MPLTDQPIQVMAQVRAHAEPVRAQATLVNDQVYVSLDEPIRGLAPGQAVVLYDGTRVIGSATVAATDRVNPTKMDVLTAVDIV